jgi:predicted acetyltransferase
MGGRFTVEIAGGRAQVTPGAASPAVRCGPRGFSALYSGYIAPQVAVAAGLVEAPPEALARLAAIFTCPPAWSPDLF